ncbi:MAG: DUF177 domain-containing protein [bacterium]|nr:DUF177 domain-containing protein [bacterium]
MFIEINKISPKGLMLDDTITLDENLLIEEESFFVEDIGYKMHLSREGEKVRARGSIDTEVSLRCVRCLEHFGLKIKSDFDIILFPVKSVDDRHSALSAGEMEYIFFDGEQIDVKKILTEQVNLFVPFRPICNISCKGLCSHCGTNLNYENCQCEKSINEVSFLFNKLKR